MKTIEDITDTKKDEQVKKKKRRNKEGIGKVSKQAIGRNNKKKKKK